MGYNKYMTEHFEPNKYFYVIFLKKDQNIIKWRIVLKFHLMELIKLKDI